MAERSRAEITTILFTDLVRSTELMQQIGDDRAQQVFQTHHDFLRDTVVAQGGEPVDWTGDGVMATFSSASEALQCAIAVQQTAPTGLADELLAVRVGLDVGEVLRQEAGSGYFGTPVVIARRLCDHAAPGQILCSTMLPGLLAGSRAFRFRELGPLSLKGLDDPVHTAEVLHEAPKSLPVSLCTLERLVSGVPDVIVAVNQLGQVVFFNDGAEAALGYSRAEALGRPVMQFYASPEEARRVAAAMRSAEGGAPDTLVDFPTTFLTRDGRQILVSISGSALVDEDANVVAMVGISRERRGAAETAP